MKLRIKLITLKYPKKYNGYFKQRIKIDPTKDEKTKKLKELLDISKEQKISCRKL